MREKAVKFCFKCGKELTVKIFAQYHPQTGEKLYYYQCPDFKKTWWGNTNWHTGYAHEILGNGNLMFR